MTTYDKPSVLDKIQAHYAPLLTALELFAPAQMTTTHPPDGWSVQDALAHITFWERFALDRLQEALRGEVPRMYGDITDEQLNAINQGALDAGRAKSLDTVRAEFAQVHGELIAAIEAMPDDASAPFWSLWPDDDPNFPWLVIEWNTYDHYDEHLVQLRAWAEG